MRICEIEGCNKKHLSNGLCKKHYQCQYRLTHKTEIAQYNKQYRSAHKKEAAEYMKQWFSIHKEGVAEYQKIYRLQNKEKRKQWYKTSQGKAYMAAKNRAKDSKRRKFGFISLNMPFSGCHGHHISRNFVIYIPKELHESIRHSLTRNVNMEEINKLAVEFLPKIGGEDGNM